MGLQFLMTNWSVTVYKTRTINKIDRKTSNIKKYQLKIETKKGFCDSSPYSILVYIWSSNGDKNKIVIPRRSGLNCHFTN